MPFTIFMCGHGNYAVNNGYFTLPKGCSLEFVVNHAKLLPTDDMYKVCEGTYGAASDRTIGEFGTAPNMTWTADEAYKIDICRKKLQANPKVKLGAAIFPNDYAGQLDGSQAITLKQWFTVNAEAIRNTVASYGNVHFVWNCCSALSLKASNQGADIGMNAGQFETEYAFLNLVNGIIPTGRTVHK